MTLTPITERLSLPVFRLMYVCIGMYRLILEQPTFFLRDKRLTHCAMTAVQRLK